MNSFIIVLVNLQQQMIKDESLEHRKWLKLYKISFLLAGSNFMVCNLLTLPLIDAENSIPLYNILLRISCIFFILTEVQQYFVIPLPSKYVHCFFIIISVIGYSFFIQSSYQYLEFNSGTMYMIGGFLVCGSVQLKLLWIITRKGTNIRRSMIQNRYGFKKHILVSTSIFIFLIGTVISSMDLDEDLSIPLILVFNIISGLLMIVAVYDLFKNGKEIKGEGNNNYSGYTSFEHQAPEILTVGD